MATADTWAETTAQIRAEGGPRRSPSVRRLYELALADGRGMIASFRAQFGDAQIIDLIHDLLAEKLDAIIAADTPKALFRTALVRRAISWRRRGDATVAEDVSEAVSEVQNDEERERRAFVLDARAALLRLPERDREIVVAVVDGADREDLAARFGTSRANVDQIVSRTKQRFRGTKP